jgi:hypothetical protein
MERKIFIPMRKNILISAIEKPAPLFLSIKVQKKYQNSKKKLKKVRLHIQNFQLFSPLFKRKMKKRLIKAKRRLKSF